jgi:hypothetical protein
MTGVLGTYDVLALQALFDDTGVLSALRERGFADLEVRVETAGRALPHVLLSGCKGGERYVLLDACVGEAVVRPEYFQRRGVAVSRPLELAVVHWVREEDPTARFSQERPRLPLQLHPGLGVLRRAFRMVVRMAAGVGKDAVASVPKFFHDAVIFFRSRLFLFLDPAEQGRFEALLRDLRRLPLGDASLALIGGCVSDAAGRVTSWDLGYQVFPLAAEMTAYFHSRQYAERVAAALEQSRFSCDDAALARVSAELGFTQSAVPGSRRPGT